MTVRVAAPGTDARENLRLALRTPTVLVASLLLLVYGTEASVGTWYSVHVSRGTPELVAGYSVSAYWVGLTIGRLSMGRLVEYLGAVRTVDFSQRC